MPGPPVPTVEAADVPGDATFVDVREPYEWEAGHIDGALLIPLGELVARLDDLPDDEIVVVCRSGNRSGRAVAWLVANGFDAANLAGGMKAWAALGRPMVSDTGEAPAVR